MTEKRYAIVRVDGKCPYHTTDKAFCVHQQEKRFCLECKIRDRYGDTKEQLIKKAEQVIFRIFKDYNGFVAKFLTPHLESFAYKIAKEIVEFLGVEE